MNEIRRGFTNLQRVKTGRYFLIPASEQTAGLGYLHHCYRRPEFDQFRRVVPICD